MFTDLAPQPNSDSMRVLVWKDGSEVPFDNFLTQLQTANEQAAELFVVYVKFIMESGELALATSVPLAGFVPLRVVYAGPVWIIYFSETTDIYICEQGFSETIKGQKISAYNRMKKHQKRKGVYER